jgi:hypothetical protein
LGEADDHGGLDPMQAFSAPLARYAAGISPAIFASFVAAVVGPAAAELRRARAAVRGRRAAGHAAADGQQRQQQTASGPDPVPR